MLSKANIKLIRSLGIKKNRLRSGLFIAEGDKLVEVFLKSEHWCIKKIFAKPEWIKKEKQYLKNCQGAVEEVSYDELKKISFLKTPHNVLAIISIPERNEIPDPAENRWIMALEDIQDPGNMGTVLRIAAWFGIKDIVVTEESVDVFNPKVVQASMGALTLVKVYYTGLEGYIEKALNKNVPVYGTVLDGKNIFTAKFHAPGIILFGNESKGISDTLRHLITRPVTIPGNPEAASGINSLNLSAAAAITCAILTQTQVPRT